MLYRICAILLLSGLGQLSAQCLQAEYLFNGNFADSSSNGNTLVNQGVTFTTDRFNNPNKAAFFDGLSYLDSQTSFDFQDRTVSVWFFLTNLNEQTIINQDASSLTYGSFSIAINSSGAIVGNAGGDGGNIIGNNLAILQWYHVVITRSATETKYYLDGQLKYVGTPSSLGSTASPNPETVIGTDRTKNRRYFTGKIDDVQIFDCVYTPAQLDSLNTIGLKKIQVFTPQLYPNPGNGEFTLDLGQQSGLVEIQVRDMAGKLVYRATNSDSNKISLNLANNSVGMYTCKVVDSNQNPLYTGKLVIN